MTADLITQARALGRAHRAEGIHPFGPVEFVRWDEGSGDLLAALGQTAPTSTDNHHERVRIVVAYCDALAGIEQEA